MFQEINIIGPSSPTLDDRPATNGLYQNAENRQRKDVRKIPKSQKERYDKNQKRLYDEFPRDKGRMQKELY